MRAAQDWSSRGGSRSCRTSFRTRGCSDKTTQNLQAQLWSLLPLLLLPPLLSPLSPLSSLLSSNQLYYNTRLMTTHTETTTAPWLHWTLHHPSIPAAATGGRPACSRSQTFLLLLLLLLLTYTDTLQPRKKETSHHSAKFWYYNAWGWPIYLCFFGATDHSCCSFLGASAIALNCYISCVPAATDNFWASLSRRLQKKTA